MKRKIGNLKVLNFILSLVFLIAAFAFPVSAQEIGAKVENAVMKEGVTVRPDNNSPTGFTATFVYKNAIAKSVQFSGNFHFAMPSDEFVANPTVYTPEQWTKDMIPLNNSAPYTKEMTRVKNTDYWAVSISLPSGGYPYVYVVDGVATVDPANKPISNPEGGIQNLSMVYMPFDAQKQVTDYSYVLPKNGSKKGTVSFIKYSTNGLLEADQPLGIYLPFGYDANRTEPYKVIYVSHGGGGNESDWFNTGSAANLMDNLIAEKKTEPAIIVTMDNSVFSWNYANITKNLMNNIIPYMEAHYNVSKEAKDRAFTGLSMGGFTTSYLYYNNTTDFGYFGVMSCALSDGFDHPIAPKVDLSKYDLNVLRKPSLFVGVGCYDGGYGNVAPFINMLDNNNINYKFTLAQGAHDWFIWPQLLKEFAEDILWK